MPESVWSKVTERRLKEPAMCRMHPFTPATHEIYVLDRPFITLPVCNDCAKQFKDPQRIHTIYGIREYTGIEEKVK